MMSNCVSVPKERAEEARRALKSAGLLASHLRPVVLGGSVLFPIERVELALSLLSKYGIEASSCEGEFPSRKERVSPLTGPVRSYTRVGDIVIFSRGRDADLEDYRRAAIQLVEAGVARAVYLKTETAGERRVPVLLYLAGEKRTRTVAKEYGIRIVVDVAKTYYNPRLSGERRNIASMVSDGWKVLDMFAGVGPFSLHLAVLRRAEVLAVDINPHAVELLIENIKINRNIMRGCITPVLADSRLLPKVFRNVFDMIIMNNPTMTPDFLEQACSLSKRGSMIVYYRVSRSCSETIGEIEERAPCQLRPSGCRRVLDYSPRTYIFRVVLERW